jgi:hypothetical protein
VATTSLFNNFKEKKGTLLRDEWKSIFINVYLKIKFVVHYKKAKFQCPDTTYTPVWTLGQVCQ